MLGMEKLANLLIPGGKGNSPLVFSIFEYFAYLHGALNVNITLVQWCSGAVLTPKEAQPAPTRTKLEELKYPVNLYLNTGFSGVKSDLPD
jgi:hypothetical protein